MALRTAMVLAGLLGVAAALAVLLDAAIELPEPARVWAPWVLGGCGLVLAVLALVNWLDLAEQRVARLVERAEPSLGNRLINAVQLSAQPAGGAVEECLRREAVELGRRAAEGAGVWPVVRRGVNRALGLMAVAGVLWLGLGVGGGDILRAVMPRFLDPRGDHPPYSTLKIEVSPKGAEVLYGGQIEVRATASGRPVDKLWLVAHSGARTDRAIMFLAPDRSFFQTLANLREPAEYFVTDGQGRSRRFPIHIRYTPQITLVEVEAVFPDYTGKPPQKGKLGQEPQALPEQTRLTFRVASNRPLKSGSLELTPVLGGKRVQVPLKPESEERVVAGGFTLTEPVVFSLSVRDVSGLDCADPRQGRFNLLPDQPPRIFVLEPGRDAVATPSVSVPVRVEAQDDYAVTRVLWLRGLNRSIERPFSMKLRLKGGPQSVEAAGAFDFAQLGVHPGDVLEYYFEAAENYPKGPNAALSRLYRIEIISQADYEAILRQAAARKALFEPYFHLDAWFRRLAERARKLEQQARNGSAAERAAAAKEAADLDKELAGYQTGLSELLQEATLFDVEQSFRNTLVEQHTRVGQAQKTLRGAYQSGQVDTQALSRAARELSELARTADEDVEQPAQQIAGVARLLAKADSFVKLAQEEAALAQMCRRFAESRGGLSPIERMELQELAYHQRRVQEGLQALLDTLPELLAVLPEAPQYARLRQDVKTFLEAVAEAKIQEDLDQSAKALAMLDGKTGYPAAQSAAEKMDRLVAKCCAGFGEAGEEALRFQPSVMRALGNTLKEILEAMGAVPGTRSGRGGKDGYSLFNDDLALYGSDMALAGEQAGGRGEVTPAASRRSERVPGQAADQAIKPVAGPGRVRLQPEAKFPLRYRELVGEYFRVIAETQEGGNK